MKKRYTKLKDRAEMHGFEVVNENRTRRMRLNADMPSPTGICINTRLGFLMDQNGNLYVADFYDRLIPLNPVFVPVEK